MKKIKNIGKALLVAAFITVSFASASEREQIWEQIDKLEKQVIGLATQEMNPGQKTQMRKYENEKKDLGKKALTSRQKSKQKEEIDEQINKFIQQWLGNPPDTKIKKQIRELQNQIWNLGIKKTLKGAAYGMAKSMLSSTLESIFGKLLKGKEGYIMRFYIDHVVDLSADGILKRKFGLEEKKKPTFLTSTIDFTIGKGSVLIIEGAIEAAEKATLKTFGKSLDSLSFGIPFKLPLVGPFTIPIPIGSVVRMVVVNSLTSYLSEYLKATADNNIEKIKKLSLPMYNSGLNYYNQLIAKAAEIKNDVLKKFRKAPAEPPAIRPAIKGVGTGYSDILAEYKRKSKEIEERYELQQKLDQKQLAEFKKLFEAAAKKVEAKIK